jgi:hypothetical protein
MLTPTPVVIAVPPPGGGGPHPADFQNELLVVSSACVGVATDGGPGGTVVVYMRM